MGQDALDLARARESYAPKKEEGKTENVIKMFTDADKIAAIKADTVIVKIGNPLTDVIIRPLNPKQGIEAFRILRTTLLPLVTLYRKSATEQQNLSLADFFDAFGDNINELPKLLHIIIARGNPQITLEWVEDNLDLIPDTMTLLPIFMKQNMFDTLFSPKARAPQQASQPQSANPPNGAAASADPTPTTEESLVPSSS